MLVLSSVRMWKAKHDPSHSLPFILVMTATCSTAHNSMYAKRQHFNQELRDIWQLLYPWLLSFQFRRV